MHSPAKGAGITARATGVSVQRKWYNLITDVARARSADALWRQYNALFVKLELTDFTKDKGAEQHYKGLLKKSGVSHEAKASCTPMMLHAL
eukprot:2480351-Prymnesium_polylepis.1